jgi:cytochrome c
MHDHRLIADHRHGFARQPCGGEPCWNDYQSVFRHFTLILLAVTRALCLTVLSHYHNGFIMNMKLNTIAMAVLAAGLIGMVTGKATEFLYDGGPAHPGAHHDEKRGYSIEVVEEASTGGAAAPAGPTDISALYASADIAAGGDYFSKKCSTCHTIEKGEANKVGPNLYGIMGAARAHLAGFSYSDGMKNAGGKWGWDEMNAFQWNPKKAIPGTIMAYAGNKKDQETREPHCLPEQQRQQPSLPARHQAS